MSSPCSSLSLKVQNFGEFSSPKTKFDPFDLFGIPKFQRKESFTQNKAQEFIKKKLELDQVG